MKDISLPNVTQLHTPHNYTHKQAHRRLLQARLKSLIPLSAQLQSIHMYAYLENEDT